MEVIRIDGLSFSYGPEFGLKGITFSVQSGEVMTLLGPNGSGKTTLIKCINALLPPAEGQVYIGGRDILKFDRAELARSVGYVPQSHSPSFPFTVLDVVVMGRASHMNIFQQPSKRDVEKAEKAISLVGLSSMKDRYYTHISGGERQLVLIARALSQEPKVLILDEPTAHLDFKNQVVTLSVVRRLARERNIAVIMSLHEPNHALLFSDKVALVSNGTIASLGKAGEVVTGENIMKIYGIEVDLIAHNGVSLIVPKLERINSP